MRKVKRWRFYCDFCKKSGASGGHLAKHERGCTRNPTRECGLCKKAESEQRPTPELLAALKSGGVDAVLEIASGCPACVIAAIHALRKEEPLEYEPDTGYSNHIDFDYALAAKRFWDDVNSRDQY